MSDRDQNIIETLRAGNRDLRARAEAAEKKLAQYEEDYTAIVSEKCWDDENHCPCVPHLRKRIEDLEARLSTGNKAIEDVYDALNELNDIVQPTVTAANIVRQKTRSALDKLTKAMGILYPQEGGKQ